MRNFICTQCGVQYAASEQPPAHCPICQDERQYVNWRGQTWTTLDTLRRDHQAALREEGSGLLGIGVEPAVAIGQRALLVQARGGNVLWDCAPLVDAQAVAEIRARGGVRAIAISHPHFFSTMVEWSRALDAPILLHRLLEPFVMRPDPAIRYWDGDRHDLGEGLTLLRAGVHFDGGTILHWADGADGRGALLTGDIFTVVPDRRWVSFMYSYPNLIPERPDVIRRAVALVEPYPFERIYGGWWERIVAADAKAAVSRSAARYLRQVGARLDG